MLCMRQQLGCCLTHREHAGDLSPFKQAACALPRASCVGKRLSSQARHASSLFGAPALQHSPARRE